jgi:hypothetical protein
MICSARLTYGLCFVPIFFVSPSGTSADVWSGFGKMSEEQLRSCYLSKIQLTSSDLDLIQSLWTAYSKHDLSLLKILSVQKSKAFPFLKEVCEAHIQRFPEKGLGKPLERLKQIIDSGVTDFPAIFTEFRKTEGIYGFGDLQVQAVLTQL